MLEQQSFVSAAAVRVTDVGAKVVQYTKPMIELVYEIRRRVPSALKPGIKLANPELFNELITYYHNDKDVNTVTRALIKELLSMAGESWLSSLNEGKPKDSKHKAHVYRGSVSLETKKPPSDSLTQKTKNSKKRIYRGQVID